MNTNTQMRMLYLAPKIAIGLVLVSIVWLIAGLFLPWSGPLMTLSMWLAVAVLVIVVGLALFVAYKMRKMKKDMEAMMGGGDIMDLLNSPMGKQMMDMAAQMQASGNMGAPGQAAMPMPSEEEMKQLMAMLGGGVPAPVAEDETTIEAEVIEEDVAKEKKELPPEASV